MKKICILSHNQFGYHIDSFNYCKYLRKKYEVHYISFDYGHKKIYLENIQVKYIKIKKNEFATRINYIIESINYIKRNNINSIMSIQIPFSFIYKIILNKKNIIYDVRSLSVSKNKIRNYIINKSIKFDSLFFRKKTIIDENIAKKLKWKRNYEVLELGADAKIKKIKELNSINFLYVGTLSNRNIDKTIKAFIKLIKYEKNITYTIIGKGTKKEEDLIKSLINKSEGKVEFKGYVGVTCC